MSSARQILIALPGVHARRLSGREGFFTAGRMFALLDREFLLLRLPARAGLELADVGGSALVDGAIPVSHPWMRIVADATEPAELSRLAAAAHEAVRLLRRRSAGARRRARRPTRRPV
jgi:hypothetical protein